MKVSVQYAAEHFEDLVSAVHNGEAVEIACAGQPALRLELATQPLSPSVANVPLEDEEVSIEENEAAAKAKAETGPGTSMEDLLIEMGLTQADLDRVGHGALREQSSVR
jgi:antitoxin (DNA-binding transcriptional repressor) of toxin-antitoxin stability system